ncbi:WD40 repeat [Saccharopolyspora antimicrobica]|uniref:WD-40 repeat-containing protein n=1 Tax=Saccharopolyspora antimicrobica TaxID=455193 RepID=A0A1I4QLN0_9PSEU|nr:WD40 repeat domain-containing protein [Saccharopolyspora antimicrobica]RKT88399.1 WD-40 repeat-containing protein [Saccharopolyspora antimicrobica]SFM40543.1 WD40 repeat [Saccharopolyspora antimicrobica]
MSAEQNSDSPAASGRAATYSVDAHSATGVQVGEGNTQIVYSYRTGTWVEGATPRPLVDVRGKVESPYRGLAAFGERDAAFFFGRESAADDVLQRMSERLQGTGLQVVTGVSGAGKSSLMQAGVIPRIRGEGLAAAREAASWPCVVFAPGHTPLDKLAVQVASVAGTDAASVRQGLDEDPARFALNAAQAALAGSKGTSDESPRLLLVVDQFEQLFTQCPDEDQRQAFITALHSAATTGHGIDQTPAALVVLVMRQDFEGSCANYPELQTAIQQRYFVAPMTPRQLRMAISEPAKKAGSRVDDDLVELLLSEIKARPSSGAHPQHTGSSAGVLPLLSHALDKAWRLRSGEHLTVGDYEGTGGIEGAVADSAKRAYDSLTPDQQTAARQIFTRLTTISDDGVDTADRAFRSELTEGKSAAAVQDIDAVLKSFADERLLTLGDNTVEISHETLITAWPLLHDWLADTHTDRIVHTRLRAIVSEWNGNRRDRSYLYTGSLLEAANSAAARIRADPARHAPLSPAEEEFLRDSHRLQNRRVRTRQTFIATLTVLVVGLATTTFLTHQASQDAARQRDLAVAGQLINESLSLADSDPTAARVKSLAAWAIDRSAGSNNAMLTVAANALRSTLLSNDTFDSVEFRPDSKALATTSDDGTARLWNATNGRPIGQTLTGHTAEVHSVAFSPDSRILATASHDGTARLWNATNGHPIGQPLTGHTDWVRSVTFSPDSKTLATTSDDGTARLWNATNGHPIGQPLTGGTSSVYSAAADPLSSTLLSIDTFDSVAFSPDSKTLATANSDGTARLWNATNGRPIGQPLTGHTDLLNSVVFSPDSKTVATTSNDGTARLWNATNGHPIGQPLTGHTSSVYSVAFSPDSKTLATTSSDETARLWNATNGRPIGQPLTGHTAKVYSAAFSPDSRTLATASHDGTARLWNATNGHPIGPPLTNNSNRGYSGVLSTNGPTFASISKDGTARLWNLDRLFNVRRNLCAEIGGSLTRAMWDKHVPHGPTYRDACNL